MRTSVTHRCLSGFLHDIAKLSRQGQITAAAPKRSFDVEYLPTRARPCQSRGYADFVVLLFSFGQELRRTQKRMNIGAAHSNEFSFTLGYFARHFPADRRNFALQVSP